MLGGDSESFGVLSLGDSVICELECTESGEGEEEVLSGESTAAIFARRQAKVGLLLAALQGLHKETGLYAQEASCDTWDEKQHLSA